MRHSTYVGIVVDAISHTAALAPLTAWESADLVAYPAAVRSALGIPATAAIRRQTISTDSEAYRAIVDGRYGHSPAMSGPDLLAQDKARQARAAAGRRAIADITALAEKYGI